jgi:ABC-2 type transport system ATP-binding protein
VNAGVVVHQLTKSFGTFQALEGIDLEVPAGVIGAVLGLNGAGKTTTIRILATLDLADGGRATVGGYDVVDDAHQVRSIIALTGQFAAVDGELTGRENLVMIGRLFRLPRSVARRRADELLELFGLADAAGRLTRTYSGGMRRRLDLAASLVRQPRVLFLDEPTTGLDPPSRDALWEVVGDLGRDGTTVVLTTQYLEEADRRADRITILDAGRTMATGTPAELKAAHGADVLELVAADTSVAERAAKVLADRAGLSRPAIVTSADGSAVSVTVPPDRYSVPDVVRLLDSEGLWLDDVRLHRATLEDVFATLTDRRGTDG